MPKSTREPTSEDVGNVIALEHVNVTVPDQGTAILFYILGLGMTRDPYMMVGLDNMWVNVGEQQFHLPIDRAQVIPGHIGVVIPDLEALQVGLAAVRDQLVDTSFDWSVEDGCVEVTCPWGNRLRCYAPSHEFGGMTLGIPYVEFLVRPGRAKAIGEFYQQVIRAPYTLTQDKNRTSVRIHVGRAQALIFRETPDEIPKYDGHHIALYFANFSGPYTFLKTRGLITEEIDNHQFRFKDIVDPKTGDKLHELEHEVRSLYHPMYQRPMVNRVPDQTAEDYVRGRDSFTPVER